MSAYLKKNKLHIVAVTAVLTNPAGQYLLLKRGDSELAYPGLWSLPGGKMENHDTIAQTLQREIAEETGLAITPQMFFLNDKSFVRPDLQTVKVLTFLCQAMPPLQLRLSPEFSEYKWITLKELNSLPHIPIESELELAEALLKTRPFTQ